MAKRKNADTTVPPITGSFEDAVRALLATRPPTEEPRPGEVSDRQEENRSQEETRRPSLTQAWS